MSNEEKYDMLKDLKYKLHNIKGNGISDKIKKDKLKREIKELERTMTDEDWKELMESISEIDTSRC